MASGASGRGKRGRVKARVYVIRDVCLATGDPIWLMGRRSAHGSTMWGYRPALALEFATLAEAREAADRPSYRVYRRGRREEG